jgi:hypothetical protein
MTLYNTFIYFSDIPNELEPNIHTRKSIYTILKNL